MQTTLDPEKQKQAKEYARIRHRLWLVDTSVDLLYVSLWLGLGWTVLTRDWLTRIVDNLTLGTYADWILPPLFVFVFGGILGALMSKSGPIATPIATPMLMPTAIQ
jgi:hypothetical protein